MVRTLSTLGVVCALFLPATARSQTPSDRVQYPLASSSVAVKNGSLVVQGKWTGARGSRFNVQTVGSLISVSGAGGDGTAISLDTSKWKEVRHGKALRYTDRTGSAAGIRSILLKFGANGGSIHIKAGGRNSVFKTASGTGTVTVTLAIGPARWCTVTGALHRVGKRMVATSDQAPASCPCLSAATSTWQAIQANVIARYGCTAASCHSGTVPQGGLDLSPDVAYANLVGVQSQVNPAYQRVHRYDKTHSAFWLKLAKKTLGGEYVNAIGLAGMPSNDFTISPEELEAIRLWIQQGAPEDGVVAGTDKLLTACLPDPEPIKVVPPAKPAVTDGVQFYAPPWTIPPKNAEGRNGEGEICQATYFDFSDQIPADMKVPKDDPLCAALWGGNRDCFYVKRTELTQSPNSHHSIIHIYNGADDYGTAEYEQGFVGGKSTGFGPFTCRDGANKGQTCDPGGSADQCSGSVCAGRVQSTVACFFYGPTDFGPSVTGAGSTTAPTVGGSQQPYFVQQLPAGVFELYPVKGTMVWNSHAFNVTGQPTTNEQYFNVFFAKQASDRLDVSRAIFDSSHIFTQNVPPFQKVEYCATTSFPKGARISSVSSHTHKRGLLFRIWTPLPGKGITPCTPCAGGGGGGGFGFSCSTPNPACTPESDTPVAVTTTYNDPVQYYFDTPLAFDSDDVKYRTIKFCSVYDNGATDPSTVKLQSTSPPPPFAAAPGGPCTNATVACANEGPNRGKPCNGNARICDSAPGKNDGVCDACPLRGGVTTEDEMYILLGDWYCPGSNGADAAPAVCPGR